MRAGESFIGVPNPATLITTTGASFVLDGGKYWFGAVGNFSGATATLQRQGPDGATWISMATALTTAGGNTADLPPGMYQVAITASTTASLYWEVVRINEE